MNKRPPQKDGLLFYEPSGQGCRGMGIAAQLIRRYGRN